MTDDLYNYDYDTRVYYLRLAGTYYRRTDEGGWQVISPQQVTQFTQWLYVHPREWDRNVDELIEQGLLAGDEWWIVLRRQR